jgi:EAL and modified HD-GYP domain-containing signal transduction protein
LRFFARQPIFNSDRSLYGYELLHRSGPENCFGGDDLDVASASTFDSVLLFGIEHLIPGCRAFVNCTRNSLVREFTTILPRDRVVIEVLESVEIDSEVIEACRRLKAAGYLVALDDFLDAPAWAPLVDLADFIKVDLLASPPDDQLRMAREFLPRNIRLLAEKVETYDDFRRCRSWGFTYFQGYFFSRPEMLTRRNVPANKLNYLRVLQAAQETPINSKRICDYIKAEASLSFRLLRYLNSPLFPLATEVRSIPHAVSLLGEAGTRKWVSVVTLSCMGDHKPRELVMLPLIRARFCELLAAAAHRPGAASDLFLLGLLSAMDAVLDMDLVDVLKEIKLRDETREALLGGQNSLREIFDLALLYERGYWDQVTPAAQKLSIDPSCLSPQYFDAVNWAEETFLMH